MLQIQLLVVVANHESYVLFQGLKLGYQAFGR